MCHNTNLGSFKRELKGKEIHQVRIYAPKFYKIVYGTNETIIKCKGIHKTKEEL